MIAGKPASWTTTTPSPWASATNAAISLCSIQRKGIGRPPKKVGRIFGPRRGLRLPAWPRLGHNFANDLAVSIDERHSPLRFIAAERLRGRVKRRARGGLGRVGFLLSTFHVVHHSMIPLRPPHRG